MPDSLSTPRIARAAVAFLVAGVLLCAGGIRPTFAADNEEDELPDVKVMRGIMRGLGLKRGDEAPIEYRERSPLVVPPSRDLPPPADATLAERTPAWPVDPDVNKRKEVAKRKARAIDWEEEGRALTPAQLNKGTAGGNSGSTQAATKPSEESMNPMKPWELGFKGWGNVRKMFGAEPEPETGTFVREPQRSDLTQPPPGYLTPSPSQPYGISKADAKPRVPTPADQAVGSAENR
jgi:hypothetical protein